MLRYAPRPLILPTPVGSHNYQCSTSPRHEVHDCMMIADQSSKYHGFDLLDIQVPHLWGVCAARIDRRISTTCCTSYLFTGTFVLPGDNYYLELKFHSPVSVQKAKLQDNHVRGSCVERFTACVDRLVGSELPRCCAMRGRVLNAMRGMGGGMGRGGLGLLVWLAYHNSFRILVHTDVSQKFPMRQCVVTCVAFRLRITFGFAPHWIL